MRLTIGLLDGRTGWLSDEEADVPVLRFGNVVYGPLSRNGPTELLPAPGGYFLSPTPSFLLPEEWALVQRAIRSGWRVHWAEGRFDPPGRQSARLSDPVIV